MHYNFYDYYNRWPECIYEQGYVTPHSLNPVFWMVISYVSMSMFTFLSTRITFIVPQVARDQKIISLGDFSANINPQDSCSDELVVGPYGCWKRLTNDNELRLLDLCSQFSLVLTNTLNAMKTRDIFTYHDKGPHGGWRLIDYIAIRRKYLSTFYCSVA